MAGIEEHRAVWDSEWDWSAAGEEWSEWWGGSEALWHGALLPRIHPHVPAGTILEIAPGFGRWSEYLKDLCDRLILVDVAERCIGHCRSRFAGLGHIEYFVNDGRSLAMVDDGSVDFAFSFDSLVHADGDVLESYLAELARKLAPEGVGFVHHSNLASYRLLTRLTHRIGPRLRAPLVDRGALIDIGAWRAADVSAESFAAACDRVGLACLSQETISWQHGGPWMIDALSLFARADSTRARGRGDAVWRNRRFASEARRMRRLYASG